MLIGVVLILISGGGDVIQLPAPDFTNASIEECMEGRRSVRSYKAEDLSLQQISNILWAAQGITEDRYGFRTVPSAGATYPLEILIAKRDGLFRYIPSSHAIKRELDSDLRKDLANAALGQGFISGAGLVVVITAIFERTALRYGNRATRYVYIESGQCRLGALIKRRVLFPRLSVSPSFTTRERNSVSIRSDR